MKRKENIILQSQIFEKLLIFNSPTSFSSHWTSVPLSHSKTNVDFLHKRFIEKPLYIYLANLTQRQACFIQTLQAHLDEDLI